MKTLLQTLKLSANLLVVSLVLCAAFALQTASANNIRIIGIPKISDQDTSENTVKISFDIAWDNSWKSTTPANHDAAWIFIKCWDGQGWNHVYLMDDPDSYKAGDKDLEGGVSGKAVYKVTNRKGDVDDMDMELTPGYSYAWKEWKQIDPQEKAQKCCVGFFLTRKDLGAGDVVVPGVSFTWNYGEQTFADEDDLVVKVFAVEMVFVPGGGFFLGGKGDANLQKGSFVTGDGNKTAPEFGHPYWMDESVADKDIAVGPEAGKLWALDTALVEGKIPAKYPKGLKPFYIMKYEMSQEAYCEFLNTLLPGQQDGRIEEKLDVLLVGDGTMGTAGLRPSRYWNGYFDQRYLRNIIRLKQAAPAPIFACDANVNGKYNETDLYEYRPGDTLVRNIDGQDLAMNLVSFRDLLAYAEFAGLRPMTELEYEKACRGGKQPAPNEYAWGSNVKTFFGQAINSSWNNWEIQSSWSWANWNMTDVNTGTERILDIPRQTTWTWTGTSYAQYPANQYRAYNCGFARVYSWWTMYNDAPVPLRVGIFADSTSTRQEAGATYWGVMNMSDNVAEMCISAVDTLGRKFVGDHGCGQLDGFGDATNPNWAIPEENGSKTRRYYITRGMAFIGVNNTSSAHCSGGYVYYNFTAYIYSSNGGWNLNPADEDQGNAGMISSRHRWNQDHAGLNSRDYTKYAYDTKSNQVGGLPGTASINYPCMVGIRCVRTADTVTYYRDK